MRSPDYPSDYPSDECREPLAEPVTEDMTGEMRSSTQATLAADHDGRSLGVAPPTLALPALRVLLHRDTPLCRFGH